MRLVLLPLSWLYRAAVRWHNPGVSDHVAPMPVISIGNLEVGGTGKSPIAQAVCDLLSAKGYQPAILSRGYGGALKGPVRVDLDIHAATDVGDEPMMHARAGYRVYIGGDRLKSAKLAATQAINIAVLDDGHATKSVQSNLSVLVLRPGFSERRHLLPAGRLREPLAKGLARAHWVIVNGQPTDADQALLQAHDLPWITGGFRLAPVDEHLRDQSFVLVTGVANPDRVVQSVSAMGLMVRDHLSFPDHHRFQKSDLLKIDQKLMAHDAKLLTTAKDAERLPPTLLQQAVVLRGGWYADDATRFDELLTQSLVRINAASAQDAGAGQSPALANS